MWKTILYKEPATTQVRVQFMWFDVDAEQPSFGRDLFFNGSSQDDLDAFITSSIAQLDVLRQLPEGDYTPLSVAKGGIDIGPLPVVNEALSDFQTRINQVRALSIVVPADNATLTALRSSIAADLVTNPDWINSI